MIEWQTIGIIAVGALVILHRIVSDRLSQHRWNAALTRWGLTLDGSYAALSAKGIVAGLQVTVRHEASTQGKATLVSYLVSLTPVDAVAIPRGLMEELNAHGFRFQHSEAKLVGRGSGRLTGDRLEQLLQLVSQAREHRE